MGLSNSPVRLGIFPAAASTPMGFFNQRFEALFSLRWSPGLCGLLHSPAIPPGLSMRECGAAGSASHHFVGYATCSLACPIQQSATLLGPPAAALPQVLSTWLPVSASPTSLDEYFFFISLVVGLQFSVSSGCFLFLNCCPSFDCGRRHSVSTYTSILAGSRVSLFLISMSLAIFCLVVCFVD